jgi:hypothetical protein
MRHRTTALTNRACLRLDALEAREVPSGTPLIAFGADAGAEPRVRVLDRETGQVRFEFLAFKASFRGGVRVAVGDVNGDGQDDVIAASGPGSVPAVKVFDGTTGNLLTRFSPVAGVPGVGLTKWLASQLGRTPARGRKGLRGSFRARWLSFRPYADYEWGGTGDTFAGRAGRGYGRPLPACFMRGDAGRLRGVNRNRKAGQPEGFVGPPSPILAGWPLPTRRSRLLRGRQTSDSQGNSRTHAGTGGALTLCRGRQLTTRRVSCLS